VDPHIYAEEPGLTPDSCKSDEGVSYLRQLKQNSDGPEAQDPDSSKPAADSSAASAPAREERRRSTRYRCAGSAEFRAEGGDVRVWGTVTDISLHGCYIEMTSTFPVDTKADIVIGALGIRVQLQGVVRIAYPFLGMGIAFTEIAPGQQVQLQQLLSALAGQGSVANPELILNSGIQDAVAASDAKAVVDEITRIFSTKAFLSREEFYQIANRITRS